jgi:hypothetical protein
MCRLILIPRHFEKQSAICSNDSNKIMSQYIGLKQDHSEHFEKLFDLFVDEHTNAQKKFESVLKLCKFYVNSIDWNRHLTKFLDYFHSELTKTDNNANLSLIISLFSCLDSLVKFAVAKQSFTQTNQLISSTFEILTNTFQLLNDDIISENSHNRTQFLTQTQLNSNKYASLIKFLPEFLAQFVQLIEILPVEVNNSFAFITCESLLKIIRLCKDAKTTVLLWKTLSKFLLKYAECLAKCDKFNLYDYLKQLYDTIESNLEFLKTNSMFKYDHLADENHEETQQQQHRSSITSDSEFVKLVRLCSLFYKMFKGILLKFTNTLVDDNRDNVLSLCVNLLLEFFYLAHYCPKYLLNLDKTELNAKIQVKQEVHTQFSQVNEAILANMDFSFVLDKIKLNNHDSNSPISLISTKYMLFLVNYLKYDTDNMLCLYKLFELFDYLDINFDLPVYFLNYDNTQLKVDEFSLFLLDSLTRMSVRLFSLKIVNIYLYYLLYGSVRQSIVALDLLVYLSKHKKNSFNFGKYFKAIYESTGNRHLEFLIRATTNSNAHNNDMKAIVDGLNKFLNSTYRDTNLVKNLIKIFSQHNSGQQQRQTNRQLKADCFVRLVKILKMFNTSKYLKVDKCEQKHLIVELICHMFRQLACCIADNSDGVELKSILFLVNFLQQFMIIEPNVNLKFTAGVFLRTIQITSCATTDDDTTINNLNENLSTLYTYLLNSNDYLLVNWILECLNEFLNLNMRYSDVLCNGIMRSNGRINEIVGDYLHKTPVLTCQDMNDCHILNDRLLKRVNAADEPNNQPDQYASGLEIEMDLKGLVDYYLNNQKPSNIKNILLNIVKLINDVV